MYMTASFPSASSASFIARIEPRASPSGFSCVTSRKRSLARIASAAARSSLMSELVDQLAHPHARLDARVVLEGKCRGSLQSQLAREARLEDAVRCSQPFERPLADPVGPEDADEDARMTEVGRGLDSGQVTKPMRGSLSSGRASDSTCHSDSFTLRIRPLTRPAYRPARPLVLERDDPPLDARDDPVLAVQPAISVVEELVELSHLTGGTREQESGPLPEGMVVDFCYRRAEALLQLRLRRLDVPPLSLQRPGLGKMELDRQDPDVSGAHYPVAARARRDVGATRRLSAVSSRSRSAASALAWPGASRHCQLPPPNVPGRFMRASPPSASTSCIGRIATRARDERARRTRPW